MNTNSKERGKTSPL